ncbi:MAG: alpha/beta hydrolase [Kiritimatiellae bacterium]|nr:alpha/beta hydrolase [Kiritimatiellia bacterium]
MPTKEAEPPATWLDRPEFLAVVFHPRREMPGLEDQGEFEELLIPVADQVVIGARFYAAGQTAPTLLFFHGNGEIVADYDDLAGLYTRRGINFLPVDYRGYGKSSGAPTAASLLSDANASFAFCRDWLAERGYGGPLIVMGRSLGSAAALEIAAGSPAGLQGLIIESGFAYIVPLLRRLGADVGAVREEQDTLLRQVEKIGQYAGPTLILHGTADYIIPISDARALYDAAGSPAKKLVEIAGAGHNTLLAVGLQRYMQAVQTFVETAGKSSPR